MLLASSILKSFVPFDRVFNLERGEINVDSLSEAWQTGSSEKVTRMAFSLWNECNYDSIEDFENGNALFSIMLDALRTEKPISVELLDSGVDSVIGQVTAVNEKICTVRQIDEYGCDDGIAYVNVPDITQVSYASADNSILLLLMTK